MNVEVFEQIRAIAAEVFLIDADHIRPDTVAEDVDTWDSLRHINLIIALETHFSVIFPEDQIGDYADFASLVEFVSSQSQATKNA